MSVTGYDIIGDVHGMADKLHHLLHTLGYSLRNGVWCHPDRKALFIGDLIDNGQQTVETLNTVRSMAMAEQALVIMGNHELNAVGYATRHQKTGEFLRAHSDANTAHHQAFLDSLPELEERWHWLEWFKTLPLYLDLGNVRFVHACWHQQSVDALRPLLRNDNSLQDNAWEAVFDENSSAFNAVENLLKGIELKLPDNLSFLDHKGKRRYSSRISWWLEEAENLADMVHIPTPDVNREVLTALQKKQAHAALLQASCYHGHCPVFFGHYWLKGEPAIQNEKAACVDYSAGGDGPLVAYRWSGEQTLSNANFIAAR